MWLYLHQVLSQKWKEMPVNENIMGVGIYFCKINKINLGQFQNIQKELLYNIQV